MHNISLESYVRPNRSQTRTLDGAFWTISVDVVLWVVYNVLESRSQVGTSLEYFPSREAERNPRSRCLNGALNGNIGVMKSMTMEITDSTNIAQAYAILPITWSFGLTVGFVFVIHRASILLC